MKKFVRFLFIGFLGTIASVQYGRAESVGSNQKPVFTKPLPEGVWRVEALPSDEGRWVRAMLTPVQTSRRICRAHAFVFKLGKNRLVDDKWRCGSEPCEKTHRVYVAIRRDGDKMPCSEMPIGRYVWLQSLIEERALAKLHDTLDCVRALGGWKGTPGSKCATPIRLGFGAELVGSIAKMRLDWLEVHVDGLKSPYFYAAVFCDSPGFECGDYVKVHLVSEGKDGVLVEAWRAIE